jgi:hypothetical protein
VQAPHQLGILLFSTWKEACIVPSPVTNDNGEMDECISERHFDVDVWISPPDARPVSSWVKVSKVTDKYGLFYYLSKSVSTQEQQSSEDPNAIMVQSVGDILYVEIQDGVVVDVKPEDVREVVKIIIYY